MTRLRFVSLFAGIGGIDLGLERAGHECVGQVEIDEYATRVLERHWPNTPRIRDVRDFHGTEFGPFDLLTGGYPCQPFSLAGSRRGESDERHLWPEVLRIIRAVRPRLVLLENVPGHLSLGFGRVLGDLAESGYDAEWDCIPAAAIGAPHQRDRVWIVAYPCRAGREEQHVSTESSGAGHGGGSGHAQLAYPNVERPHLGAAARGSQPIRHLVGIDSEPQGRRYEFKPGPSRFGRWEPEPDVGRVVDGLSGGAYGGLNGDEVGCEEARTTPAPVTSGAEVREVRIDEPASETSRRLPELGRVSGSVPSVPREGGSGSGIQEEAQREGVQGLREDVPSLAQQEAQHVQLGVFGRDWPEERREALGAAWGEGWDRNVPRVARGVPNRVDRLRTLGNAVVPQVAEWLGRRLAELA